MLYGMRSSADHPACVARTSEYHTASQDGSMPRGALLLPPPPPGPPAARSAPAGPRLEGVELHPGGVHPKHIGGATVEPGVHGHQKPVGPVEIVAPPKRLFDRARLLVMEQRPDIEMIRAVQDAHFRILGRRSAVNWFVLPETGDRRRPSPGGFVQQPVKCDFLLDEQGLHDALVSLLRGRWGVRLGRSLEGGQRATCGEQADGEQSGAQREICFHEKASFGKLNIFGGTSTNDQGRVCTAPNMIFRDALIKSTLIRASLVRPRMPAVHSNIPRRASFRSRHEQFEAHAASCLTRNRPKYSREDETMRIKSRPGDRAPMSASRVRNCKHKKRAAALRRRKIRRRIILYSPASPSPYSFRLSHAPEDTPRQKACPPCASFLVSDPVLCAFRRGAANGRLRRE